MADNLQIDIIISPEKAKAQMQSAMEAMGKVEVQAAAKTARTKEDIFAKARDREYSAAERQVARELGATARTEKQKEQLWANAEKARAAIARAAASEIAGYEAALDKTRATIAKATEKRDMEMYRRRSAEAQAAAAVEQRSQASTPAGIISGKMSGLSDIKSQIAGMEAYRGTLARSSTEYKLATTEIGKYNTAMHLAETGNARGRGELHKYTAKLASMTFELTGAVYGITALAGIIAAPAMFGTAMLKRIEDAQTGITGILISMGELDGKALSFGKAWQISGQYVKEVQKDSLKYGIDMGRLMEVNQAAISGGLNAMLSLKQIQQVATAGAVAVSSLGLNSQQYVQEVRDLISGGIQPASSTLARSIGVTDALLKTWKAEGPEKLIKELTDRLQGFMVVADEVRTKTLTGSWDILQARLAMLLSDESGFGAIKKTVIDVANYIGKVDVSGKFVFNKDALAVATAYWDTLKSVGSILVTIGSILVTVSPIISKAAEAISALEVSFQLLFEVALYGTKVIWAFLALLVGNTEPFKNLSKTTDEFSANMERLGERYKKAAIALVTFGDSAETNMSKASESTGEWERVTGKATNAAIKGYDDFVTKHSSKVKKHNDGIVEETKLFYAAQLEAASAFSTKMVQLSVLAEMKKSVLSDTGYSQLQKDELIAGLTAKERRVAGEAESPELKRLRDLRKEVSFADGSGKPHRIVMEEMAAEMRMRVTVFQSAGVEATKVLVAYEKLEKSGFRGYSKADKAKEVAAQPQAMAAAAALDLERAQKESGKLIDEMRLDYKDMGAAMQFENSLWGQRAVDVEKARMQEKERLDLQKQILGFQNNKAFQGDAQRGELDRVIKEAERLSRIRVQLTLEEIEKKNFLAKIEKFADATANVFGDVMYNGMMGKFGGIEEMFKQMIARMLADAAAAEAAISMKAGLKSLFGLSGVSGGSSTAAASTGTGLGGQIPAGFGTATASALGNVFLGGSVRQFSLGGIPDLGNQPAAFQMANGGMATIREGGAPEAIMPLKRDASGRLGVSGGGGGTTVQVNDNTVIHIDSRSDRMQVMKDVQKMIETGHAKLRDNLRREGQLA